MAPFDLGGSKLVNWFKVNLDGRECYTPYEQVGVDQFCLDRDRPPAPGEIVDTLKGDATAVYMGDGFFERSVDRSGEAVDKIPPGAYRYDPNLDTSIREGLVQHIIREDEYLELEGPFEEVIRDINDFNQNKDYHKEIKCLHKMGILLYGPGGTGKSVCIRHAIKETIKDEDALIIFISGNLPSSRFLAMMRDTLNDRLKVFVFEELTTALHSHGATEKILNFLDGENSLDNKIVLATTNYPEHLPENIVNRPSRFDKIYEFDRPTQESRERLLKHYLRSDPKPEEIEKTDKMTVAEIKEVVSLMKISKLSLVDAIKKLERRRTLVKGAFKKVNNDGFGF